MAKETPPPELTLAGHIPGDEPLTQPTTGTTCLPSKTSARNFLFFNNVAERKVYYYILSLFHII